MESSFREVSISYIAGTINKDEVLGFRRLLFRATRGKALTYFCDISVALKDYSGDTLDRVIYVIVF